LKLFRQKAGIISSVYRDTGLGLVDNAKHQSTPEAPIIQQAFHEAVQNGLQYMVLETTSHGLSERTNRVGDVEYDAAVMTNVTHEHLEFHGTMERYIDDKANLFRLMSRYGGSNSFGVVNTDDNNANSFIKASSKPVYTYGIENPADYRAVDIEVGTPAISFTLVHSGVEHKAAIGLPGIFNVSNALAALVTVTKALDVAPGEVADRLKKLGGIYGRMTAVNEGQPFRVVVDFAHTPDSFNKLLPEMKSGTTGKLIVLFGSGGERDTGKRPVQGSIASQYADIIILTDEDPRGEDSMAILEQIAAGCRGHHRGDTLFLIPNREGAILKAFQSAGPDDTVLLLGKGHETSISYSHGDEPWDEIRMAAACLNALGYQ
jgi:UDP-N-acetylmuramoyl-L-alanyl-D-glutamate--2,6-diaminopimelate ligase